MTRLSPILQAFKDGGRAKWSKPYEASAKPKITGTVTTPATPEVKAALAKVAATLKRHGVASEFTRQGEIIRRAILAYAESFE